MVPDVPEWIVRIDGEKRAVIVRDDPGWIGANPERERRG